jgi:hypothetical protein
MLAQLNSSGKMNQKGNCCSRTFKPWHSRRLVCSPIFGTVRLDILNNVVLELKAEEEDKKGKMKRTLEVEIEWIEGDESGGALTRTKKENVIATEVAVMLTVL